MGLTPTYALPYPELADSANVPRDNRALAEATELAVQAVATAATPKAASGSWALTAAQSIASSLTTVVKCNSGMFAPTGITFDQTTGVATIQTAGVYLITGSICYQNSTKTGVRHGYVYVNNTIRHRAVASEILDPSTIALTTLWRCAAGDTIWLSTYQSSGATLPLIIDSNRSTIFSLALINP